MPVLVYANKSDLMNALEEDEIEDQVLPVLKGSFRRGGTSSGRGASSDGGREATGRKLPGVSVVALL